MTTTNQTNEPRPRRVYTRRSFASASPYRDSERENRYLYSGLLSAVANFQLADQVYSTTTVGGQYTENKAQATECYGSSLVAGTASCGTTSSEFFVDEDFFLIKTVGAYVQQEFAWRDKVFVAAGIRGDDNSAFGSDFGFVTYPSGSVSWVIAEEDWFPQIDFVSGLRLRSAVGTSGLRRATRRTHGRSTATHRPATRGP